MKYTTLVLVFICFPAVLYAQYIEGRVVDNATGSPIKNAHVYIDFVEKGTSTFSNGKFQLKFSEEVPEGAYISISHLGYHTAEIMFERSRKTYNIALIPKVNVLNEVALVQNEQLKPYLKYEKMKSMSSRLHAFGSLMVDDKIYVIGGNASFQHDGAKETMYRLENSELAQLSLNQFLKYSYSNFSTDFFKGDMHVYDLKLNTWERRKDLFKKRAHHNLFLYENKMYIMGGINLSMNKRKEYLDNTLEIFDLDTGEIIVDETNPHQAVNFSSFVVGDDLIVLGGSTKKHKNGTKEYSSQVHMYRISEGLWYEVDSMPTAKETAGILVNDKIFLIGGFNKKSLATIETFNLNTKKWEAMGHMFFGMSNPALGFLNNIIYIYNNGKICTLNTVTGELNEYFIDIDLQNSKMHIVDGHIYLIGGLRASYKEIAPSSSVYRIPITEFEHTRIRRSKTL